VDNSPVVVPRETLDEIVAIGPVRYLVAPTALHIWRLEQWHKLFPEAQQRVLQPSEKQFKGQLLLAAASLALEHLGFPVA
jgi:hypothetical protein